MLVLALVFHFSIFPLFRLFDWSSKSKNSFSARLTYVTDIIVIADADTEVISDKIAFTATETRTDIALR